MKYFSYDPHGYEMQFHETAEAAERAAIQAFDEERDCASEGWSEDVDKICWGEVAKRVTQTVRRPIEEDDNLPGMKVGFDEFVDYELLPTDSAVGGES